MSASTIQVFVRTLRGPTIAVDLASGSASSTLLALKQSIADSEGIPVNQQRIHSSSSSNSTGALVLEDGQTVDLTMHLCGGAACARSGCNLNAIGCCNKCNKWYCDQHLASRGPGCGMVCTGGSC